MPRRSLDHDPRRVQHDVAQRDRDAQQRRGQCPERDGHHARRPDRGRARCERPRRGAHRGDHGVGHDHDQHTARRAQQHRVGEPRNTGHRKRNPGRSREQTVLAEQHSRHLVGRPVDAVKPHLRPLTNA